jgi:hypothetical protein
MNTDPKKQLTITESEYQAIQQLIENPDSPVGIDAKQTHILILQKLIQIEKRISALEQRLDHTNENT